MKFALDPAPRPGVDQVANPTIGDEEQGTKDFADTYANAWADSYESVINGIEVDPDKPLFRTHYAA
jgi:hypothetical protein